MKRKSNFFGLEGTYEFSGQTEGSTAVWRYWLYFEDILTVWLFDSFLTVSAAIILIEEFLEAILIWFFDTDGEENF